MSGYRANVEKGAAFLDERMPGWLGRVDVATLDLGSCLRCVLGQLGGNFIEARGALGLAMDDTVYLGFNVPESVLFETREYEVLTEEWRAYIAEARQQAVS